MPKLTEDISPQDAASLAMAGLIYSQAVAPIVGSLTDDELESTAKSAMHAANIFIRTAEQL
jgi:hypothetical protein